MTSPKKINNNFIRLFLIGIGMGSADIVPGVSGGTIAFIFGIYQELIHSIKLATAESVKLLLQFKIKPAFQIIPFKFLMPIFLGIFTALLSLANLISYLLKNQPTYLWSFFFGLVLASIFIVRKRVTKWKPINIVAIILATVFAYILVGIVPVETPSTLLAYFISGAIAISAMILPGVSGSFLLVIMGKYSQILEAVVQKDILTLAVFTAGTIIGLALFSQLLNWLFKKHHNLVVAILTGFMIGSLRKIWPWKQTIQTTLDRHNEIIPLIQINILPKNLSLPTLIAIGLALIGLLFILYLNHFHATEEHITNLK